MLWQMGGPTLSWGASGPALPAGQWRALSPSPLFWGVASLWVLWPVLGTTISEGSNAFREYLKEGHKDSEGEAIWEIAEVTWLPQLEKRRPREGSLLSASSSWVAVSITALWGQWRDPREWHGAVLGEVCVGYQEKFLSTEVGWTLEQASQGMIMALGHELDRAQAHGGIVWAVPCRARNWIWSFCVPSNSRDSVISLMLATVRTERLQER